MQRTLVILKPDCVARRLAGNIIGRFERKGLRIAGLRLLRITLPVARRIYAEHKGKPFYVPLLRFLTSGPAVVMAVEGKDAVAVVRRMLGPTFGPDAPPGTIRGDFGMSRRYNLVHGSDSPASARRELLLFFKPGDLVKGTQHDLDIIYDVTGPDLI